MMKFILAARRKPEDTQENYFYQWSIIHVALMITNPSTLQAFRRYAQHYAINDVAEDLLLHPRSPMAWDNMADHWLVSFDNLVASVRSNDYIKRLQPHRFGDSNFVVELTGDRVVFEEPGFKNGGVKLIHFLRKHRDLSFEEFDQRWKGEHAAAVIEALKPLRILRKYVQSPRLELEPTFFKGTLFEAGGVGIHAGIEEFWFHGVENLARLRNEPKAWNRIVASDRKLAAESSFSMVTTERVVFDYATAGIMMPKPAVLTPGTLESMIDAQGYVGFDVPKPPGAHPGSK
jgi:EthD domain